MFKKKKELNIQALRGQNK